jgi:hypothetical protein
MHRILRNEPNAPGSVDRLAMDRIWRTEASAAGGQIAWQSSARAANYFHIMTKLF